MIRRLYYALAIVLGLALAATVGFVSAGRPAAPAAAPASLREAPSRLALADLAEYEARLERLDRALERERALRTALSAEVAELRVRIGEPRGAPPAAERVAQRTRRPEAARPTGAVDEEKEDEDPRSRRRGLDVEAMVAAGFEPAEVHSFKAKMDQLELDRLYLRDLAAREGWLDTPRFREEDVGLDVAVRQAREELGDEFYDWMLYTSGHPNRVRVDEVLAGSAAAAAGLQPGDLILSYGDQRVFGPGELRDSTRSGTAGDTTQVSVLRDGHEVQVSVPRGPLGVRIDVATEQPPPVG